MTFPKSCTSQLQSRNSDQALPSKVCALNIHMILSQQNLPILSPPKCPFDHSPNITFHLLTFRPSCEPKYGIQCLSKTLGFTAHTPLFAAKKVVKEQLASLLATRAQPLRCAHSGSQSSLHFFFLIQKPQFYWSTQVSKPEDEL